MASRSSTEPSIAILSFLLNRSLRGLFAWEHNSG
jgi:hypothetical protein